MSSGKGNANFSNGAMQMFELLIANFDEQQYYQLLVLLVLSQNPGRFYFVIIASCTRTGRRTRRHDSNPLTAQPPHSLGVQRCDPCRHAWRYKALRLQR